MIEIIRAAAGFKDHVAPGVVFQSLADLKVNEDEESEEDLEKSYRDVRALLSQVAQQATPVGNKR